MKKLSLFLCFVTAAALLNAQVKKMYTEVLVVGGSTGGTAAGIVDVPSGCAVTEAANPNGSRDSIAGICNGSRNVLGLMPHPERACEDLLGSSDGRDIFRSLAATLAAVA